MSVPLCLGKYQDLVADDLHNFLDGSTDEQVKMIYYHLGWVDKDQKPEQASPGKYSRPLLLLYINEILGGNTKEAMPAASAIQIFHDFTLMHDDIEDGDALRRHRETVWKVWGVPRAINAGDAMYTLNFKSLLRLTEKRDEVLGYLLDAYSRVVAGQEMDLAFVGRDLASVRVTEYMQMIEGKSAILIGASAKVGAMLANAGTEIADKMYEFGKNLGLAYQIYDDFVGIWCKTAETGKAECMDIISKKKSLPILQLMQKLTADDRKVIESIYSKDVPNSSDVATILEMLDRYEIKESMIDEISKYRKLSHDSVESLDLSAEVKANLFEIIEWLIPEEVA